MSLFYTWIKGLLFSTLMVLAPIKAAVITVVCLTLADCITGMLAAHKRKEKISSAAMRRTVSKMLVYLVALVGGFITETYLIDQALPVSKIVAGLIGLSELKSVLENADTVLGGSLFKSLLGKLGSTNDTKLLGKKPEEK